MTTAVASNIAEPLLTVRDLETTFFTDDGPVPAVASVSFAIAPGEALGSSASPAAASRSRRFRSCAWFPDRAGS
jgi:hypothetical protein